jgi:hypothetical protein
MLLPWSDYWENNYFAQTWPAITPFVGNSFVRGGITGLGIVNLIVGVAELAPVFSARAADEAPGTGSFEPQTDSRAEP